MNSYPPCQLISWVFLRCCTTGNLQARPVIGKVHWLLTNVVCMFKLVTWSVPFKFRILKGARFFNSHLLTHDPHILLFTYVCMCLIIKCDNHKTYHLCTVFLTSTKCLTFCTLLLPKNRWKWKSASVSPYRNEFCMGWRRPIFHFHRFFGSKMVQKVKKWKLRKKRSGIVSPPVFSF